ncbi:MAG: hypothetical protein HOB18_04550 [Nitrospina sp.]|jgi:hypothetical protein|nr:hypothetical protein [Nitrospina sp.]
MDVDRFTKFVLSVIAFSLCLNALNPWISPTLANANEDFAMERAVKKIAGGVNKIADNLEKMVEIEKDLFVYWPLMEGSENIVAMFKDQNAKEPSRANQACSKEEKLK